MRGNSEIYNNREQITNNSEIAAQFSFSSDEVLELNLVPPKQYHLASSLVSVTTVYIPTPHAPSLRKEGNPVDENTTYLRTSPAP